MTRVAFIGLGVMGYPMAGHLARAGYQVVVFNRDPAKSRRWVAEYGGEASTAAARATPGAHAVFCCLGNDQSVREVVLGENGLLAAMEPGAVLVDHTTASAGLARELERAAAQYSIGFVDAPVSGGEAGARKGILTVMAGGSAENFARIEPMLGAYARRARLIGAAGAGQLAKMVNQICIAGVVQGLAEGLHFGRAAGLDMQAVIEVISAGAAQSWQMENRHHTMLAGEYRHGFAVDWMRKDLGMVLEEARNNGASLPLTALVDQFYAEVQALGGGRWDTSSLLARLECTAADGRESK
ncbi:MAG: NAD(P)-dependent oxidoreductase [Pseudomonadales bacterium]|nr:NAD(P)-dependent oxidoreductase [Gammaproteobacteria bacterium]MBP6053460.1 NAD(P)-dependent oxidoreductase [Pseudomonadales bacterium]MBK6585065.1 NAD(P)-dependent oxidoreductase [Gammaproteobacteria bacterium]MBK7520220.1 NAD(P)-dependent oxidoreductase [Gammaproteobacteria bacterium]MBK8308665.1 NAD(P)-dependent oxidoreductase [Gammaproteobacteria bacterium]